MSVPRALYFLLQKRFDFLNQTDIVKTSLNVAKIQVSFNKCLTKITSISKQVHENFIIGDRHMLDRRTIGDLDILHRDREPFETNILFHYI